MQQPSSSQQRRLEYGVLSLPVIIGALGFFVDVYDLLLFNVVRIGSFKDLGVTDAAMQTTGENILTWQMIGLSIGGIAWGILGDKKGRKSVLFSSILLYSIATIGNGFVHTVEQYTWLRFLAGLGLAGELGASITLVSEMLPRKKRGLGAAIIATCGVFGTIAAYFVYRYSNGDWRLCYFIGGGMGLLLLLLRIGVLENRIYDKTRASAVRMGNFLMLFEKKERFFRYLRGILIGLPVWYVIGVLITFSNNFAAAFHIENFDAPKALMIQYVALAFGDMGGGIISNLVQSRKKTLILYYLILAIFIALFFATRGGGSATNMYLLCAGLGFGSGISVLYITMSAEQFGTNLRATAAISIPNLVRGCLPLILLLYRWLRGPSLFNNSITGAWVTGIVVLVVGFISVLYTHETFGKEMNYTEE